MEWKLMGLIMSRRSEKHPPLSYVTHNLCMQADSKSLGMTRNVNTGVSNQSRHSTNTKKPLYHEPQIGSKNMKGFYAAVHWSHCLAWKIPPCQMPVEWPDSKSVTRLWKQACLWGPGWTRCQATADPKRQCAAPSCSLTCLLPLPLAPLAPFHLRLFSG